MKTIFAIVPAVCSLVLQGCAPLPEHRGSESDDFVVCITEDGLPPVTTAFLIDKRSLRATPTQNPSRHAFSTIRKYTIANGQLTSASGRPLTEAFEILAQTTVGGDDFIVLRDQYNSRSSPLNLLALYAGHPIQVDVIFVVKVVDGSLSASKELTRKEASYHWRAVICKNGQ